MVDFALSLKDNRPGHYLAKNVSWNWPGACRLPDKRMRSGLQAQWAGLSCCSVRTSPLGKDNIYLGVKV